MSDAFDATPPEISTPRLRLKALLPDDAPAVFAYASNPEIARFTLWRPHSSELFTKGFIKALTQPPFLNWAITQPPVDQAIGMIFLHSFSKPHQKAEIAFNLAQAHWNQGLATEAAGGRPEFCLSRTGPSSH
jgi:ribosomal-protein-alanine N-acetyltransferase